METAQARTEESFDWGDTSDLRVLDATDTETVAFISGDDDIFGNESTNASFEDGADAEVLSMRSFVVEDEYISCRSPDAFDESSVLIGLKNPNEYTGGFLHELDIPATETSGFVAKEGASA